MGRRIKAWWVEDLKCNRCDVTEMIEPALDGGVLSDEEYMKFEDYVRERHSKCKPVICKCKCGSLSHEKGDVK
jgi:hypothetical protein